MADEAGENTKGTTREAAAVPATRSPSELKPKDQLKGTVARLELYGAFVDIGTGTNAILHISKLGKHVNRVSDVLSVGDEVTVWVDTVEPERDQITVTMVEPLAVEWRDLKEGQVYSGKVTRLEKFGAFVDIGAEKEGLVHVSELSREYVKHPSEVVKPGDEISVKVLGFSRRKRRIDLSHKATLEEPLAAIEESSGSDEPDDEEVALPTAMEIALRRAMDQNADYADDAGGTGKKARSRRNQMRQKQDDILSRTLKMGHDASE